MTAKQLCIDCGESERKPGHVYCQECYEILAEDRAWQASLSVQMCVDCNEAEATVADLYCKECEDVMMEQMDQLELIEMESNYDLQFDTENSSLTKGSINKEYLVNHTHPQLGCTHCKPHRGENTSPSWKHSKRKPKQKTQSKDIKQGSEFKRRQHEDY
jgi:hypothetical protein